MKWNLPGMISDGGVSFPRLQDGRLAFLAHRQISGFHGGGLSAISFSTDAGQTWTPAKLIGDLEGVWCVMNDRFLQTSRGQLIVPVAHMPADTGTYEGDKNLGLCFFSPDGGVTWKRSRVPAQRADLGGMQEPCIAEMEDHQLLMLARTGSGSLSASRSIDDEGMANKERQNTDPSVCFTK